MKKVSQSVMEYALMLGLIAVISVTVMSKFGHSITSVGNRTDSVVNSTTSRNDYCSRIGKTLDPTTGLCK